MDIADIIKGNLETILSDWDAFAGTCLPAAQNMNSQQLRNEAQAILLAIADDIRQSQTDILQRQKARGLLALNSPRLTSAAHEHAADRFSHGFTLNQLISEYRALRASVSKLCADEQPKGTSISAGEISRFNEAIDQVLVESVNWFSTRLDRARDLFLAVLSHDLRDPLGAISMSADTMIADPKLVDYHRNIAARIPRSAARMGELIENLLDFTRARLGTGIPISPRPSDFGEITRHVVEELSAQNPGHRIELDTFGDLKGTWDSGRLQQVISNLIANAVKHGDLERAVTVEVRGETDVVIVTVHNYGDPISEESRRTATEPLIHGPIMKEESQQSQRIRLGLFIARQIVESHSGKITVESNAETGTEFTVRVPRHVNTE